MANYKRRKRKKTQEDTYVINEAIQHPEIRLIDEDGFLGIFSIQEARQKSEEEGLDLVEINPKAKPPVVKLIDFAKFKYQQDKSKKSKPKTKSNELKTLRVSVRISEHDLKRIYAKKTIEFLESGLKVKLQVQMRGREKQFPEVAKEVMEQFLALIDTDFKFESEPKLVGDSVYATLKPNK